MWENHEIKRSLIKVPVIFVELTRKTTAGKSFGNQTVPEEGFLWTCAREKKGVLQKK